MTTPLHARLHRNLEALALGQPDAAECIASASIPQGVVDAVGRDGSPTFRVPHANGWHWLGRSSAPTISAEALIEEVVIGGDNLVLPGVLTGQEILLLVQRVPAFAALFVLEPQVWPAKLVLQLCDCTEHFRSGRLVLLPFDDPFEALVDFFVRHPGYEVPGRLITSPQCSPPQIAELERQLSRAVLAIQDAQRSAAEALRRQWQATAADAESTTRVVVLSTDPQAETTAWANVVADAIARCGAMVEICVPDRPARGHTLARLATAARYRANLVLSINAPLGRLEPWLPEGMANTAWFLSNELIDLAAIRAPGSFRVVFAASATIAANLIANCLPAQDIQDLAPGLPDAWWARVAGLRADHTADSRNRREVALVADVPDDRAEALGIHQVSQRQLWEAVRKECGRHVASPERARPADVLARAVRTSGVPIEDEELEAQFCTWIESRAMPAAWTRSAFEGLHHAGIGVTLCGSGWHTDSPTHGAAHGPAPMDPGAAELTRETVVLVFAKVEVSHVPLLLSGLAQGCGVVVQKGTRSLGEEFPDLAELEPALHVVDAIEELVARTQWLRALGSDPVHREEQLKRWSEVVGTRHLLSHRVAVMLRRCTRSRALDPAPAG